MQYRSLRWCSCLFFSSLICRADFFYLRGDQTNDTFEIASSPSVSAWGSYEFRLDNISVDENGTIANLQLTFFSQALGRGLLLASSSQADVNAFGAQLYTGASDHPTFKTGVFSLNGLETNTLTISPITPTPEPATPILLSTAILLVLARGRIGRPVPSHSTSQFFIIANAYEQRIARAHA